MLSVNKLEKVIELEEQLKAQYEEKLQAEKAEVQRLTEKQAELDALGYAGIDD